MSKRRGKGEGSVYRRESDGKWVGTLDLGWQNGKRVRKYVYSKTKAEALKNLRELQAKSDRGEAIPDGRKSTSDYLAWWVTTIAPTRVKVSTADDYAWIIRRYLDSGIGRIRLAKLGPEHVDTLLRDMETRGLSPRTRRQARAVLRSALSDAERYGWVSRNAAALSRCPKIEGSVTGDALSLKEAKQLLSVAQGADDGAIVTVALMIGLRLGEALALRWADVDLDSAEVTIRGTLKRRSGHGLYIDTPKTARGRRTLQLPGTCVSALRAHRRRQTAQRLKIGAAWQDADMVFTTSIGTAIDPRNQTRRFHQLTSAAGLGNRRFHSLRHSAATLMLASGVPLETISTTLGHAGLAITSDIYAKVTKPLQRQAADAMEDAFRNAG